MRSAVSTRICTRSPAHSAPRTQGPRHRHGGRADLKKEEAMRRLTLALVVGLVGSVLAGGVAYATHLFPPQLPPGSAALGFLVSNNRIEDIPVEAGARAAHPGGGRGFGQHASFAPGQATRMHNQSRPGFR